MSPSYGARGAGSTSVYARLFVDPAAVGGARAEPSFRLDAAIRLALACKRAYLAGAVRYWDGQFDDARLAVALARTAIARSATVLNHCAAVGLMHGGGRIAGVEVEDRESGQRLALRTRCVVNATGVWVDAVRRMDRAPRRNLVAPSQGVHVVVDRDFLPGGHAILVPKTEDGRVLFAVPWLGKTLLGTTDTPRNDLAIEPEPFREEIDFILGEASRYLAKAPTRADIRSVWVGLRPLVKPPNEDPGDTKALSREHAVLVERSGLVTVTGGKWTTYRAMAEDVLAHGMANGLRAAPGRCAADRRWSARPPAGARASVRTALPVWHRGAIVQSLPGAKREWRRATRRWCASPCATNTRARWRTCWRAARASCSSTRAWPLRSRSAWPHCSRRNWAMHSTRAARCAISCNSPRVTGQ